MSLSLRWKLLLALALILLPSLILVLAGDVSNLNVRRSDVLSADRTTADTVASLVDASIDDAVAVGQALATSPLVQPLNPRVIDSRLERLGPAYLQFDNIMVVNARGESIGDSNPGIPRINVADRPYFRTTMEFNAIQVSPIVIGRRLERPTAVVSIPIRGSNDRPIGAVLVALNLDYFRAKLWSVPLGKGRVIVITDPTGQLAFVSDRWDLGPAVRSIAGNSLIRSAISGVPASQQSGTFPFLAGQQTGVVVPSAHYHWVAAVLQPTSEAEAGLGQELLLDVGSFALALFLGTLAILYLANQIISPILKLDAAAREWSSGHLGVRVSIHTGDELERLGNSLDEMAASLASTLRRLADADRRLTNERNRLKTILDTSPAGIIVLDADGRIIMVNAAAEGLFGGTIPVPSSIAEVARSFQILRADGTPFPIDELPAIRALREGAPVVGVETIVRHPNGWETHLLTNAAPLRRDNEVVGAVIVFFDITPLVEEERLRREFVLSAAHEFRHPLTVIKGYGEVAMRNPAFQNTPICHELGMIVDAADRASKLADQLLRSAQIHLPPLLIHLEPIDLAPLVRDRVAQAKRAVAKQGYEFTVKTVPALVEGDPKLLGEAVDDLLRQAEAAMPKGGDVDVRVSAWDGIATVAVTDHGPVVPPEAIGFLFRPFGMVPSAATEATVSRPSLPLYLARRIVEESGGWIRAVSSPAGTTISFSLPRRFPSKESETEEAAKKPQTSAQLPTAPNAPSQGDS
ncbi:MAG: cache domain-containing protein, partial [Chloroflexota bacterium]